MVGHASRNSLISSSMQLCNFTRHSLVGVYPCTCSRRLTPKAGQERTWRAADAQLRAHSGENLEWPSHVV